MYQGRWSSSQTLAVRRPFSRVATPPAAGGLLSQLCPSCHDPSRDIVVDESQGDIVCRCCGLVIGARIIDEQCEWRTFMDEKPRNGDQNRVGCFNAVLGNAGLATRIGSGTGPQDSVLKCHNRLVSKEDHDTKAYSDITELAKHLGLQKSVVTRAQYIFRDASTKRMFKRQLRIAVVSTVYAACRVENVSRSMKEIAKAGNVTMKQLGAGFKALKTVLRLKVSTVKSTDFLARFCNGLGLQPKDRNVVAHITEKAQGRCHGRNPLSIAAACIWMVCSLKRNQVSLKDIATMCGVATAAIRAAFADFHHQAEDLLPREFLATVSLTDLPGLGKDKPASASVVTGSHPRIDCVHPPAGSDSPPTGATSDSDEGAVAYEEPASQFVFEYPSATGATPSPEFDLTRV